MIEAALTIESFKHKTIIPSTGLKNIDPEAEGWVNEKTAVDIRAECAISVNAGFGGINSAVIISQKKN